MLILTRRCGEAIKIGAEVTVTVLGVKGNQVRIGIAAPRSVVVDREEVTQRKAIEARVLEHPSDCTCLDCCYARKHPQIGSSRFIRGARTTA